MFREDSFLTQLGIHELIERKRLLRANTESLYEMPFESKGIRKTRPQRMIGITVGVLGFVEKASKVFGVELEMDIDLSRLGRGGWNWSDRWYQRRNQGKECVEMHCGSF